jgi:hypothetical protein
MEHSDIESAYVPAKQKDWQVVLPCSTAQGHAYATLPTTGLYVPVVIIPVSKKHNFKGDFDQQKIPAGVKVHSDPSKYFPASHNPAKNNTSAGKTKYTHAN